NSLPTSSITSKEKPAGKGGLRDAPLEGRGYPAREQGLGMIFSSPSNQAVALPREADDSTLGSCGCRKPHPAGDDGLTGESCHHSRPCLVWSDCCFVGCRRW